MSIYDELSDILEEDVTDETVLNNCEMWDSLASMSIIALASTKYNKNLTADMMKNLVTVKDIITLIKN